VHLHTIYKFQYFIGGVILLNLKFYCNLVREILRQNFDEFNIRAYRHIVT